ncbi:hypothetical protein [Plantibacter sp. YIM 135249]|uniref:hypothetical protein n=1 Tax=Plantibacter sp. YIM 135249 TaxID=3423918 RepID=UPI003D3292F3
MAAQLNTYVALLDDEMNSHYFGPGDNIPKWARKRIQNPDVWVDIDEGDEPSEDESVEVEAEPETEAIDEGDEPALVIPPKAGPGSSAKAWAEYALALGFETDGDAKASEIREALAEAGHPVE